VVESSEIRRLDRNDAAFVMIAKPHFSKVVSSLPNSVRSPVADQDIWDFCGCKCTP